MTEEELRVLVRDAVARHLGEARPWGRASAAPVSVLSPAAPPAAVLPASVPSDLASLPPQPSFGRYALPAGDGRCLIEPAVRCTHCGYCQSHGY